MEPITINECIRRLGKGRSTIKRYVDQGSLPSVVVGASRRIVLNGAATEAKGGPA